MGIQHSQGMQLRLLSEQRETLIVITTDLIFRKLFDLWWFDKLHVEMDLMWFFKVIMVIFICEMFK